MHYFVKHFRHGIPEEKYFTKQLIQIKNLLSKKFSPSHDEVINILGHSVNALHSVPTALYCFLRNSQTQSEGVCNFKQTLEYTITLGGDTDTIASMACALSGAFYSDAVIPESLAGRCESSEEIIQLADKLFSTVTQ